ncbi:ABC transporter permease [Urbifossiella limnaea]|uniref:Macrolide export ATP-binding/permease protein MacB n=1 Tax=Urbifossiella limnaea TaxID=2528023 RepID=A0A517XR00_9BACT|nr:ABC transporter permease [Urbifossiella limnaea]QDU19911.1 Macrolide export ATP-binding/permease protein MacB [Urbifossiella limnaea]
MNPVLRFARAVRSLAGTMVTLVLSLLPLTALLVALPAVAPNEAVLSDSVPPATTRGRRFLRRLGGLGAGFVVVVALFAFAVELVGRLPLPDRGQFGSLAQKVLGAVPAEMLPPGPEPTVGITAGIVPPTPPEMVKKRAKLERALSTGVDDPVRQREAKADLDTVNAQIAEVLPNSRQLQILLSPEWGPWLGQPIWKLLPPPLVQHWPFIFLVVYAADLGLLLMIGRVPLAYNFRNLVVRWRIAGLTSLAFTVVVGLLVVLLAFVNGMYKLNEGTGIPGNVFVLSDGATDELFSNLGYGDTDNALRQAATLDPEGNPLPAPVRVARVRKEKDGTLTRLKGDEEPPAGQPATYLASKEIYFVVSQPVPVKEGEQARRRLLNMRAVDDAPVAAAVHNISLYDGGRWFTQTGVRQIPTGEKNADGSPRVRNYVECVLGEGAAGILGADANKPRLEVGDTFQLGDLDWIVVGIMKAEGTTFGSEVWVQNIDVVTKTFGKKGTYTTMVLRCDPDTADAAKALAYHLQYRYTAAKFKPFAEPDYYAELTKTNDQFLTWIVLVAAIMAIGGVFGVMNTMFAAIAARIREVGVLRILGFKRWQILISFMLESLAIAAVGGMLGCVIGFAADGMEARSQLSSGAGGGKSVSLRMVVDYQTVAAGMLFTLVMGRLGGLVPALSAMRMEILDSLR